MNERKQTEHMWREQPNTFESGLALVPVLVLPKVVLGEAVELEQATMHGTTSPMRQHGTTSLVQSLEANKQIKPASIYTAEHAPDLGPHVVKHIVDRQTRPTRAHKNHKSEMNGTRGQKI